MSNTKFDQPDWESQLKTMMGEHDAEELARKFRTIINEHYENQDQPVGVIEVALSPDEVVSWMHTIYDTLSESDVSDGLRDILWNVGLELVGIYLESDDIDPDEKCNDLIHFLWITEADDDD